jgi:hypothetical protein
MRSFPASRERRTGIPKASNSRLTNLAYVLEELHRQLEGEGDRLAQKVFNQLLAENKTL